MFFHTTIDNEILKLCGFQSLSNYAYCKGNDENACHRVS